MTKLFPSLKAKVLGLNLSTNTDELLNGDLSRLGLSVVVKSQRLGNLLSLLLQSL
jgi:hypothetical protein